MYFEWLSVSFTQITGLVFTTLGLYAALLLLVKIAGLRSFSKMSSHDFAITIAIGSIIGATVLQKEPSLTQGIIAIALLLFWKKAYSYWRLKRERQYLENEPMLLMRKGAFLHDNLKKCEITVDDLYAKLREANALNLAQVHAVVLETTGDVSVLHGDGEFEEKILKGVKNQ